MLKSTTLLLKKHILPNLAGAQGLENLRSDLPRLEFHADHDAVRIINNGKMLYKLSPIAEGLSPITNRRNSWVMSGRFSKTQVMRASAFNYAALNKHA